MENYSTPNFQSGNFWIPQNDFCSVYISRVYTCFFFFFFVQVVKLGKFTKLIPLNNSLKSEKKKKRKKKKRKVTRFLFFDKVLGANRALGSCFYSEVHGDHGVLPILVMTVALVLNSLTWSGSSEEQLIDSLCLIIDL